MGYYLENVAPDRNGGSCTIMPEPDEYAVDIEVTPGKNRLFKIIF